MRARQILHCDCNCFYASVEMQEQPRLRGKAIAVCGDPEARHGIVLTASYPAKRMGVKTGMAIWQAQQCCRDLIIFPPRDGCARCRSFLTRDASMPWTGCGTSAAGRWMWAVWETAIPVSFRGRSGTSGLRKGDGSWKRSASEWSQAISARNDTGKVTTKGGRDD